MNVSLVILNYNGLELLKQCLPSVVKAAESYGHNCEIIVVDNGSFDQSQNYIKSNFPQIKIVALDTSLNFAQAMNTGIKQASYSIVIGLNNDIIVDANFISPLVSHLAKGGDVFAVSPKMLLWDKKTLNLGKAVADFKLGFFRKKSIDSDVSANTLHASGGAFAVNRSKFLELGGFDEDINGYWEDADLCYRGWKRGLKTVYEPKSIVYHKAHGTSLSEIGQKGIDKLSGRNYYLFIVKNIHDKNLFYRQILFTPPLLLGAVIAGKPYFACGICGSLEYWPLFLKKRREERLKAILSDKEVLEIACSHR